MSFFSRDCDAKAWLFPAGKVGPACAFAEVLCARFPDGRCQQCALPARQVRRSYDEIVDAIKSATPLAALVHA